MSITHKFTNLSGIEYEVTEMNAKHQRLISQQENGIASGSLNEVLADTITRVGSINVSTMSADERTTFVQKLPSEDRRKALFEIRQLTNDFQKEFTFQFRYKSKKKDTKGKNMSEFVTVNLETVISEKPYEQQATELADFQTQFEGVFPRSLEGYQFTLSNGNAEGMKFGNISSHTPILLRSPKRKRTTDKQGVALKEMIWLTINSDSLDKLSIKDIEALRLDIHNREAMFESTIEFDHPEADYLPTNERKVTMDILFIPAFYFPSGVI